MGEVPACAVRVLSLCCGHRLVGREDSNSDEEVMIVAEAEDHQPGQEKKNPGTSGNSKIKLATEVIILLTAAVELAQSILSCFGS